MCGKFWFTMIGRIFSKVSLSALLMAIGILPIGLMTVTFTTGFALYGLVSAIIKQSFEPAFYFIILPVIFNLAIGWLMAALTLIIERKHIKISSFGKKLAYILAFPLLLHPKCLLIIFINPQLINIATINIAGTTKTPSGCITPPPFSSLPM